MALWLKSVNNQSISILSFTVYTIFAYFWQLCETVVLGLWPSFPSSQKQAVIGGSCDYEFSDMLHE